MARYYQGGRLRVPGDGVLLAAGSGLVCLIVAWDAESLPGPWIDIFSIDGSFEVTGHGAWSGFGKLVGGRVDLGQRGLEPRTRILPVSEFR
jgi:hypothetical protein